MVESMGSKCQCCGYNKCSSALAFHHIDPKKKDLGFGSIRANPKSWKKIVKELKKCILVCHNCHSEIHAGMRQLPADYTLFDTKFEDYREVKEHTPCPVCGTSKPATQKFCSHRCSQTNRRKVDWDKIDLLALMEKHSIKDLEQMLGISNAAIYKRRKKILANT
jgi:predicted nucleic acid-binding Zn ribbon protein